MISMTTIDHLQRLIDARFGDELRLGTTHLLATGEVLAVVVDQEEIESDTTLNSTLAVLKASDLPFVTKDGALTDAARAAFASLKSATMEGNTEAWLSESPDGHVDVVFARRGARAEDGAVLITLPWADPDTLFEKASVER
jgi:hypothetical protein